ncbi:carbohydrate-binding protein [Chromobacterium sp. IIBBL 290-4]|uniref:carbohydrate-binding protein n=1 Tax=Chromobacterium sp. IIBBL 290-4 TaxID=2953890 RepID=UPI0020B7F27C|nr:carbohydrate-binding protein [Chromobacterium sp. IIBBL 290-4]UTH75685.1 hypothetical protein NKT35_06190 [Chromobacterium sp. IIBBL 290-4]
MHHSSKRFTRAVSALVLLLIAHAATAQDCPNWQPNTLYQQGAQVLYLSRSFTALRNHQAPAGANWNPVDAPSLWRHGGQCANAAPQPCGASWQEGRIYLAGEIATYQNLQYTALTNHLARSGANWNPAQAPSLWKKGGICQPVVLTLEELASPASLYSVHLQDGDTPQKVEQVSGPALQSLTLLGNKVNVITGMDTGSQEQIQLMIQGRKQRYLAKFSQLTLAGANHGAMQEPDETGKLGGISDLTLKSSETTLGTILSDQAGPQTIAFYSPSNRRLHSLQATLDNGSNAFNLKDQITLQSNGQITLHTDKIRSQLQPLQRHELYLFGYDSQGDSFNLSFYFYYANNRIHGQLKQNNAQIAAELKGAVVALRGFGNRLSWVSQLSSDGKFDFGTVPIDNYLVELIDPNERHAANAMFLVTTPGKTIFVPLELTQPGSAMKSMIIPLGLDSSTYKRPQRHKHTQAKPSQPQHRAEEIGSVNVIGGQQNVTMQQEREVFIPTGINRINILTKIDTKEYPGYSTDPNNKFNDSWSYWWTCAGQQKNQAGQVNNTHSHTGELTYSHGITLDPKRTSPIQCRIGASTVNIGDSSLPTSVDIQILGAVFSIEKFEYKNGLWLDDSNGGNKNYNISLPTKMGQPFGVNRPWEMDITFSPINVDIRKVALYLSYQNKQSLLTENAPFSLLRPGLIRVKYAITDPLLLNPAPGLAQLQATLFTEKDGVTQSSQLQPMTFPLTKKDTFQPLFEIRNVSNMPENRRYGSRDDATGGDGWLRNDMLAILNSTTLPLLGDISGQHAWQNAAGRSMGVHSTHKGGYDADLRYWDENGRWDSPMRGDNDGAEIIRVVNAARAEVKSGSSTQPNLNRLINWIRANRAALSALESQLAMRLRKIYIGDKAWFNKPLIEGRFPDGVNIPLPGINPPNNLLGPWVNKSAKIVPMVNHNHHFHIRLVP